MKKVSITLFTFVCAICMILGVAFMNVNTAKADTTGTTPTLSETKVMVSNEQDKMLLATAIKNYADVYKVGYEFTGDVTTTIAENNKYYTSISCGSDTLTPEDIFDESWAGDADIGMIIWEVDFEVATSYEFKAYASVAHERLCERQSAAAKPRATSTASVSTAEAMLLFQPCRTRARTGNSRTAATAKARRKGAVQGSTKRMASHAPPTIAAQYTRAASHLAAFCCMMHPSLRQIAAHIFCCQFFPGLY